MKNLKMIVVTLAMLMGIFFTSCVDTNSNSSSTYDFYGCATVYQAAGGVLLVTDGGLTLAVTNPSDILLKDGTYPTRIFGYYKLAAGEVLQENKTAYTVEVNNTYSSVIPTKDFNQKPDTLANYAITSLDGFFVANHYATVSLSFPYASGSSVNFDMFEQKVSNDTLYVKLNYSKGGATPSYQASQILYSFKVPEIISDIQPKNDSIWVKVSARGAYDQIIEKSVRCKYEY